MYNITAVWSINNHLVTEAITLFIIEISCWGICYDVLHILREVPDSKVGSYTANLHAVHEYRSVHLQDVDPLVL